MVRPSNQTAYTVSNGTGIIAAPVQEPRDPTTLDVNYTLYQTWQNTATGILFELVSFTSTSGTVLANWVQFATNTNTVQTLTGNSGGAVSPTGSPGNINILGSGTTTVAGVPGTHTLTVTPSQRGYPITQYVTGPLDPLGNVVSGYQNVQQVLAYTQAQYGPFFVGMQGGWYVEDLDLKNLPYGNNLHLWGVVVASKGNIQGTALQGQQTIQDIGEFYFANIQFITGGTSQHCFIGDGSAGSDFSILWFFNCNFSVTIGGHTLYLPGWEGSLTIDDCGWLGVNLNDGFLDNTGGSLTVNIRNSFIGNGTSHTAVFCGAPITLINSTFDCPLNFTAGTTVTARGCTFNKPVTFSDNSTGSFTGCTFSTGSSTPITMGSSASWSISETTINTSANPAIAGSGAGTLTLGGNTFINGKNLAGTLTLAGAAGFLPTTMSNGQLLIGSTGAVPATATLTPGPGVSITNGAGSITVGLTGGSTAIDSITPGSGIVVAPDVAGNVNFPNGNGIATVGTLNTLTTNMASPFSGSFTFTSAAAGALESLTLSNTSNTASSDAAINVSTGGASARYAYMQYSISGGVNWSQGVIGGDSNFYLASRTGLGGDIKLQVTTTGNVTVPSGDLQVTRSQSPGGPQIGLQNTGVGASSSVRLALDTGSLGGGGDAYSMYNVATGFPWQTGHEKITGQYRIVANTDASQPNMFGTTVFSIDQTGNTNVLAGDLTVTRAAGLPEVFVTQTGTTDFARFRALGTGTKTGFFSSGTSTGPLYWNFGMASTLSNAYCLNTSNASVAPEGGTLIWKATTAGEVTMPLQPAFSAYNSVARTNQTGDGTAYTVIFNTEEYDQGSNFDGTSTFTASVNGKYHFCTNILLTSLAAGHTSGLVSFNRSDGTIYYGSNYNVGAIRTPANIATLCDSKDILMSAGQTMIVQVTVSGSTKTVGIDASAVITYFTGRLVC